jgi:hypothetical protein
MGTMYYIFGILFCSGHYYMSKLLGIVIIIIIIIITSGLV